MTNLVYKFTICEELPFLLEVLNAIDLLEGMPFTSSRHSSRLTTDRNMVGIGIRSSPSEISFAIVEEENGTFRHSAPQELVVPRHALDGPSLLLHIHTNMLDILRAYDVNAACVKEADYHPQASGNPERYRLEGVMQLVTAVSPADHYISGDTTKLARYLDLSGTEFKDIKNGGQWDQVEDSDWQNYTSKQIESILAAYAAVESYD